MKRTPIRISLLTPNKFSRPHLAPHPYLLTEARGICIHWVENPGANAAHTRRWFEGHKTDHKYGSAHFAIDDNEIVQMVPLDEVAYHAGPKSAATQLAKDRYAPYANEYLIGMELSHPDDSGVFTKATLWRTAWLCAYLCNDFGWDPTRDLVRHYDITEKLCPKWFVEDPDSWEAFKEYVLALMVYPEVTE